MGIGIAVLLVLSLYMFADVLFTARPVVLSDKKTDLAQQFIYWRAFAARELGHGHLPLWNPHVFSGMPFLGWGQTGLLYPLNWLDLLLPLEKSVNVIIALHVFLAGTFTYLWMLQRRLHPVAGVVAATLFMFGAPYFLHIYAGHMSLLCTIAWLPLVFVAVEGLLQTRSFGWVLLGSLAVTMQVLAGDTQACFYTAIAAGFYLALNPFNAPRRVGTFLGFVGMYLCAAGLGAVQILTSLQATSESVRAGGVSYQFASMLSFAPENLITLIAPGFFGDMIGLPYWGRWYLWEMCAFVGVAGLVLAGYGVMRADRRQRVTLISLVVILVVLALGSNTPLFAFLYNWMPGFDRFRAIAKFVIQAALVVALLAGMGLDHLLHARHEHKRAAIALVVVGVLVGATALHIRAQALADHPSNWWARAMLGIRDTRESYFPAAAYTDREFVRDAGVFASKSLAIAAGTFVLVGGLLFLTRFSLKLVYIVGLVAVAEVFVCARHARATFDMASIQSPQLKAFLEQHPGDYRFLRMKYPNLAMWLGGEDIWGYAPLALKRYAEFMAFTQGQSPEGATQYVRFSLYHPLYQMLRCRFVFIPTNDEDRVLDQGSVMSRLELVSDYQVLTDRDAILSAMIMPPFDPRQQVILETEPDPTPVASAEKGTARVVESSSDDLVIEADLPHPAILLITDAYSAGWHARPLPGSVQSQYEVLPGNYILRAVPLSSGHHHFQVEYLPSAFQVGKWISIIAAVSYAIATGAYVAHRFRGRRNLHSGVGEVAGG